MANDKIRALSDREQAREKLPIFFGSRDNYLHGFKEVMNNAIDEVLNNFPNGQVDIILHDDLETITVKDSGRGMPIADKNEQGVPYYELIFTTLFAGGKYDENNQNTTGVNGVGNTTLNFTSESFNVIACNNGKKYIIEYYNGGKMKTPLTYLQDTEEHSTKITFKLDKTMYTKTKYNYDEIKDIVDKTAKVSPNITLTVQYQNNKSTFHYNNLQDYFELHTNNNLIDTIKGVNKKYEESTGEITQVELVMSCSNEENLLQECMLNGNNLTEKSSISEGILNGMRLFINKYLKENNLYNKKEKPISKEDIENSITYCCNVLSNRVEFQSQTKFSTSKKLYTTIVQKYIQELLEIFLIERKDDFIRIAKQILINKRVDEKANQTKNAIKKKLEEANNAKVKIEGLTDCDMQNSKLEDRWILIVEGKSPKATVVEAFDNTCMGALGLRGRFISCLKKSIIDVLNNAPAYTLIKALGCGIEIPTEERKQFKDIKSFNKDNLRYGNIGILTDADCWGSGIRLALLTFIYKYLPTLLKENRVYIIISPRYEIKMKNGKMIYAYNDREKEQLMKNINEKDIYNIGIVKGIGEINKDDFWDKVLCPEVREKTFIQVKYDEVDEIVNKYFEDYMGEDTAPRKEFVKDFITNISLEDIN